MPGAAEQLWQLYQASPPALLTLLTIIVAVGGRYALRELGDLHDKIETVEDKVDRQEMLIDRNATEIERQREARKRNDRRIQQVLQNEAAAHGFDGRPGYEDPAEDTAAHDPDRSDGGING